MTGRPNVYLVFSEEEKFRSVPFQNLDSNIINTKPECDRHLGAEFLRYWTNLHPLKLKQSS